MKEDLKKVTFTVRSDLYAQYKKVLIDLKTTSTADLRRHIAAIVENNNSNKEGK